MRPAAERWLRAAPEADATWEFRSSQEAVQDALDGVLAISGSEIALSRMVFQVEPVEQELRIHIGVHHPVFPSVPESVRMEVSLLVLDWLLGEDDVERWVGHIEALEAAPVEAADGAGLLRAVASIADRLGPDDWSVIEWENEHGTPGLAMVRQALRWIDFPTLDVHHGVSIAFAAQDNGFPADDDALGSLDDLEGELDSLLGSRGLLVGHETISGYRTFHVYTDGEDQNAATVLADWARSRHLAIESANDPAWRLIRHFTG